MFVVILAQCAATSRAYAARYEERHDENTDLVGLSLANVAAGLSGTFVVNGSPTKTQMVDSAGGRTQLSQLACAAVVLIVLPFAVTLVAGLALVLGQHGAVAAMFLSSWFIIALTTAFAYYQGHETSDTLAQVVAWAGGVAVWIAFTFVVWLVRGRKDQPAPIAELAGDTPRRPLTGPFIMFALIRAVAIAVTAALAFGLNLFHGAWLIFGAFAATKPSLNETTVRGVQRLAGTLIGAAVAGLLLLIPANEQGPQLASIVHGLTLIAIVLFVHGVAMFFWNYAFFEAAIVAGVLILVDLPHPANYSAEGYRVLWTLCGIAIGVLVMLVGSLLGRLAARKVKAQPQPA
jgi:hypothetical protein